MATEVCCRASHILVAGGGEANEHVFDDDHCPASKRGLYLDWCLQVCMCKRAPPFQVPRSKVR